MDNSTNLKVLRIIAKHHPTTLPLATSLLDGPNNQGGNEINTPIPLHDDIRRIVEAAYEVGFNEGAEGVSARVLGHRLQFGRPYPV